VSSVLLCFLLTDAGSDSSKALMVQAIMCKAVEKHQPVNPAVVFSISQGEVVCFSKFDPVQEKTIVFHKWYKQDKLIFTIKLKLSPPRWSTFSRMQIRDEDKGPWRVEIRDEDDMLLKNLRFSIAD
jgi:hypothetical protein